MLSPSKSTRIRFVMTMCMVLAGGAVSMGTSCITGPKKAGGGGSGTTTGTINGSVDSLGDNAAIPGATVVATTSSGGSFSLTDVPAGSGTLVLSTLPTGCTVPAATNYSLNKGGTLTYNIVVDCPIQLP
jgi:hypothetical protein